MILFKNIFRDIIYGFYLKEIIIEKMEWFVYVDWNNFLFNISIVILFS